MKRGPMALVLAALLSARAAEATTMSSRGQSFIAAVGRAARVVRAKVIGPYRVTVDGEVVWGAEIELQKVLKGPPAKAGERLRVFDPYDLRRLAEKRGRLEDLSFADTRYDKDIEPRKLAPGLSVLVMLGDRPPPAGFPPNAVFLTCNGAFEKARRDREVVGVKGVVYGEPVVLAKGESAVTPQGCQVVFAELLGAAARIVLHQGEATRPVVLAAGERVPAGGHNGWWFPGVDLVRLDGATVTLRVLGAEHRRPSATPADAGTAPAP